LDFEQRGRRSGAARLPGRKSNLATGDREVIRRAENAQSRGRLPFPVDAEPHRKICAAALYFDLRGLAWLTNRHRASHESARDYLNQGYVKVETPILSKARRKARATFGAEPIGAGKFYALPRHPFNTNCFSWSPAWKMFQILLSRRGFARQSKPEFTRSTSRRRS
jgi:aspartyl-tRNA synthetase